MSESIISKPFGYNRKSSHRKSKKPNFSHFKSNIFIPRLSNWRLSNNNDNDPKVILTNVVNNVLASIGQKNNKAGIIMFKYDEGTNIKYPFELLSDNFQMDISNVKFLVVEQNPSCLGKKGFTGFPKGEIGIYESTADAAIRELEEETGIVLNNFEPDEHKMIICNRNYFYLVPVDEMIVPTVKDSVEIKCAKWITFKEFQNLEKSSVTTKILNKLRS